jgi:hypothetical protein
VDCIVFNECVSPVSRSAHTLLLLLLLSWQNKAVLL